MRILAIETSCDDTAIALLEGREAGDSTRFTILGNAALSQIELHREYGGVYPTLAKREHAKNLVPLLAATLEEAGLYTETPQDVPTQEELARILEREPGLSDAFLSFISRTERPQIDAIAVTHGPGLAPALWVGVNFTKALSLAWNIPVVPINHMEGHLLAGLLALESEKELVLATPAFPLLTLLISGGHTELVLMRDWFSYTLIGRTRDDAVGEAFDKVARMLGLPYPGGPEISKLAEAGRASGAPKPFTLPRPMLTDDSCDFSWSGIKTSVLYLLKKHPDITQEEREKLAEEFEDAVCEVLWKKTSRALDETNAKLLALGGGVSANKQIRKVFAELIKDEHPETELRIPPASLTTDNAIMIAVAGYFRAKLGMFATEFEANSNLSLSER